MGDALTMDLFQTAVTSVLFLIVIGLLLYTLKTSGDREKQMRQTADAREHRLLGIIESYSQHLAKLADQLEAMARDISDITKRLERLELRDYSSGRDIHLNQTQIGERARTGQTAVGRGLSQEDRE